jgi:alanine racemase
VSKEITGVGAVEQPRALARVNVNAIARNCARLCSELRGSAKLCAVVKADGYGHGAVPAARAALAGGARWLAVADAAELCALREAGITDARVLVMGPLGEAELARALAAGGEVTVWNERQLAQVAAAGGGRVHVKLDTGMGRLGTRDVDEATRVVRVARALQDVELAGAMTHFATADDLGDEGFFSTQLAAFVRWVEGLRADAPEIIVHAANSAATLREPTAHFDMVRCGIAIYGMDPFGRDPAARGLEPSLELSSYVADVKRCAAGQSAGYGRRFVAEHDTWVGVVPIGYGDGWRRGLSGNADVLVGGRRQPLVGTVSMDSITIDLGGDEQALNMRGERAIVVGFQGSERITAEEVARRLETINYEVTCGLTPRVRRVYHRDGALDVAAGNGAPALHAPRPAEVIGPR